MLVRLTGCLLRMVMQNKIQFLLSYRVKDSQSSPVYLFACLHCFDAKAKVCLNLDVR